jgi:hypothetical protein
VEAIIASIAPIWKVARRELRDSRKLSKETKEKLQSLSVAISKAYLPDVILNKMQRAFEAGHVEAAMDALLFCE